jgi:hypothetical protein
MGSCSLEDLSCVSIQEYVITQEPDNGAACVDDDGAALNKYSTRLRRCSQDCKGGWENPNTEGDQMCEKADDYKARMTAVLSDTADGLCGGVEPVSDLTLCPQECLDVLDLLNGVGEDSTSPCGFNLAIDAVPTDAALCSAECSANLATIQACNDAYDIFAGAVQYEVHMIARQACNGGSTMTCSGEGETRQLKCASTDCVFVPQYGVDPFGGGSGSCGRNPPKRDCVGGWRFPIDSVPTEWGPCVDGKQRQTCKTEAAFGGDNKYCMKDGNGEYKPTSRDCAEDVAALGEAVDPAMRSRLDALEAQLQRYEALMGSASVGNLVGSTAEAPTESNMVTTVAMGIGGVVLFVVAVAVVVRADRRVQRGSYEELGNDQQDDQEDGSGTAELRGSSFSASC